MVIGGSSKEVGMNKRVFCAAMAVIATVLFLGASLSRMNAGQPTGKGVRVDNGAIGGVVTSSKGPEAGVWVIAETKDLPTKFAKIVVTDDAGRYVIPDLPKANYSVWVRGYGLVDSSPVQSVPGKIVNLTAVVAPDPHAAAQYYPAAFWYSLLQLPAKSDFPGTGSKGNGISENMKSQGEWIELVKTDSCESCHQLGDKATREFPESLGHFDSSVAAWGRRVSSAQVGPQMNAGLVRMGKERALAMFANWTDRIAAGEYPHQAPPRPQGMERNVVITEWDWGSPKEYFHDEISTDRRNPTVNANGLIYGVHEVSSDYMTVLDPAHNAMTEVPVPVRDPNTPFAAPQDMDESSPYWGKEPIWNSKANVHSLMMDAKGRVWTASTIRPTADAGFCKQGSSNPSAMLFPLERSSRQASVYDPETKKFTTIDLCFGTQHLMFAEDVNNTLWFSNPGGDVTGWLNTKMLDETHDEAKAQGWTALVLDTNGNGKRDAYVEPDQPVDPTKDKRIRAGFYAVSPSPVDGSIWGTVLGFPGAIVRLTPGSNPPATALAEIYEPPMNNPKAPAQGYRGYSPRGMDIDRNGVIWTVLASGHLASFDRRKCKGPLNGPTATGQQCPEGWALYPVPGPSFKGTESGSADSNYYDWVDQFDTFGMGKNVPIATGNGSDSLLALSPGNGKFVVLRVPYPMGFYAKSLDGRIDDPKAGWKGKGLWSTYATRAPQHIEGGKGTTSKVVHFQLRPDPLAD
jgi:hypothetical protein